MVGATWRRGEGRPSSTLHSRPKSHGGRDGTSWPHPSVATAQGRFGGWRAVGRQRRRNKVVYANTKRRVVISPHARPRRRRLRPRRGCGPGQADADADSPIGAPQSPLRRYATFPAAFVVVGRLVVDAAATVVVVAEVVVLDRLVLVAEHHFAHDHHDDRRQRHLAHHERVHDEVVEVGVRHAHHEHGRSVHFVHRRRQVFLHLLHQRKEAAVVVLLLLLLLATFFLLFLVTAAAAVVFTAAAAAPVVVVLLILLVEEFVLGVRQLSLVAIGAAPTAAARLGTLGRVGSGGGRHECRRASIALVEEARRLRGAVGVGRCGMRVAVGAGRPRRRRRQRQRRNEQSQLAHCHRPTMRTHHTENVADSFVQLGRRRAPVAAVGNGRISIRLSNCPTAPNSIETNTGRARERPTSKRIYCATNTNHRSVAKFVIDFPFSPAARAYFERKIKSNTRALAFIHQTERAIWTRVANAMNMMDATAGEDHTVRQRKLERRRRADREGEGREGR